jgi:hypothetical protein
VEEINKESMSTGLKPAAMDPSLPATSVPILPFTRRHHANLLHSVLLNQVPPVEEACLVHPPPARQHNKKASPPLMAQETVTQNREYFSTIKIIFTGCEKREITQTTVSDDYFTKYHINLEVLEN